MSYEEYLKKVEGEIDRIKYENEKKNKKANIWADFGVVFTWSKKSFEDYFSSKKMRVDISPCGCGDNKYDIFIRW